MTNKTGWITQADVIIGFNELSESEKSYSQSQKVYINPDLEPTREANRKAGITYIVSIAGNTYEFHCAQDAWKFEPVFTRGYCGYDYFIGELNNTGKVWSSGDVEVKIANKNNQGVRYCVELGGLKWTYKTALEAWHNKALEVRKSCPPIYLGDDVITGIKNFEDFVKNLDDDAVLAYHALRVYKTNESEV